MAQKAEDGDRVKVHYVGTLENGETFDSSRERDDPLDVRIGDGNLIEPFEKALIGLEIGKIKNIVVAPEDGYGLRQDTLVHTVSRRQLPPDLDLKVGMQLQSADQQGNPIEFVVTGMDDDQVILDSNHPLAGKTLKFELEIVEIVD